MHAVHISTTPFENQSRVLKETQSLVHQGIVDNVTILAKSKLGLPLREEIDGQRLVMRLSNGFIDRLGWLANNSLGDSLRDISYLWKVVMEVRRQKPHFINLHHIYLLVIVPFLRRVAPAAKLIYDAHELETETYALKGFPKRLLKRLERYMIRLFDHVFVVSPSIEKWYRDEYDISNVTTVMNCPQYWRGEKKNFFREEFSISPKSRIFLYQGALFRGRGLEVLLEAFRRLDESKYSLIIMGYGPMQEHIQTQALLHKNIFFKQAVHPDVVLSHTSSADFGISLIENTCLSYYYCLPNKLFEYLMAGVPCIVSDLPEMRKVVETWSAGIVCMDMLVDSVLSAISKTDDFYFGGFYEKLDAFRQSFSWASQEEKMIGVYRQLLQERGI
ncbi:MAG: glycosyltransferase [Imperialibacter sp.]